MKYFLSLKKENMLKTRKNSLIFLLVFLICFSFFSIFSIKPALALLPGEPQITIESASAPVTTQTVKETWWQSFTKMLQKAGSIAFQRTLASALNKIAYDAANYIGSGGQGQKPLFVTASLGDYLTQIGDEAAGQYIETFVNNLNTDTNEGCAKHLEDCRGDCNSYEGEEFVRCTTICDKAATSCVAKSSTNNSVTPSFNVCSPSSLEAKVRIGLGLVDQNRPQAPNCTVTKMIKSWGDDVNKKIASLKDPNYLNTFVSIFDPRSNDLGVYLIAKSDMSSAINTKKEVTNSDFVTNGGWLDVRNIAGALEGVPGEAQRAANSASEARQQALGKTTGDIFVDAANVFINQLYVSAFDNLLRSLAKKSGGANTSSSSATGNQESDPTVTYGESSLKEVTSALLQPKFGVRTDYNILSELAVCMDAKNPGPNDCVIDDKFMQAITEKKTVAEAIKDGYLHSDWQLTTENNQNSYSLRNISILRKYRILPVGWEEAVNRLDSRAKRATLKDLVSCFDYNDEYSDFSSGFDQTDQGWCQGLIDPNWVLKAPLNYCKKEGFSSQIISSSVVPGSDGTLSKLNVIRAENYCADNQTCIKEKDDGSCEVYGYCNEEKRTWDFGTDSCSAINNTCQSFTGSSGQSVSYLKNTLDYGECNADNSGCRRYSISGAYASSTGIVTWDGVKSIYLNKNLGDCGNEAEGCSGLLRVKPSWGANLVMNSDFANDKVGDAYDGSALNDWPLDNSRALIVEASQEPGNGSGKTLKLTNFASAGGVYSSGDHSLLPANFQIISGQAYTLSADVYLAEGDSAALIMGTAGEGFVQSTAVKNNWQHLSVTRQASSSYNELSFKIFGYSSTASGILYVKNIKFELSDWGTDYSSYGSFKFYEKLLPSYLEKTCYVDATSASKNYALRSDAPSVCSNYARRCNKDEVDCESYQSVKDNFAVPAKVVSSDYCPSDCLGYDVYISKANHFSSAAAENIIPNKTTVCSAAAAGCTEFTNLDALASGGENKEYYTSLKHCIKPEAASCASFYSWEGTANGYQLKAYSLKKDSNNLPEVTSDDSALCNATIYHLPISDPAYNADCREFYNAAGAVSYHLAALTITCSDNCHAYRMSEKNIDKSLSESDCVGTDKHWNSGNNYCNVCLNGGTWDNTHSACVYQAIPGEGQTCQASESGCREYNGNGGSNVKMITYYDFEGGLGGWHSNCQNGVSLSSVANNNNGHSLQYNNSVSCGNPIGSEAASTVTRRPLIERILAGDETAAQLNVTGSVQRDAAYSVKFLARAASNVNLKIYFINKDTQEKSEFSTVTIKGGNDWNIYQANLDSLNHEIGNSGKGTVEVLALSGNGDFFLDDIILSEISDRYYLIKGSSQIPDICYYDTFDKYQGADYNLGCSQYTDRSGNKHNLHKFTKLCSESAVGCEQMIDTKNYSPYGPGFWENGVATSTCSVNDANCVSVGGDSAIYAVYDQNKQCTVSDQGCSRLGQGQGGVNLTGWSDVFKQNNPDQYNNIICSKDNVGCEEWTNADDSSLNYFKNPGSAVCSYRASKDPNTPGKSWYRVPVKRCDLNSDGSIVNTATSTEQSGTICSVDKDCGSSRKCLVDNNDYPCSFSYYKTIGLGGAGNQVQTPDKEAGLCEASASSCTEYIDPVSQFSTNLISNPDFRLINGKREGWGIVSDDWTSVSDNQQVVNIKPNKLYSLMTKKSAKDGDYKNGNVKLEFKNFIKPLLADNTLGTSTKSVELINGTNQPIIFNSLHNDFLLLTGGNELKTIEIKELAIGYKLQSKIDKTSCNGIAKFDNGCILFNERSVSGASGLANLANGGYDAFASVDGKAPTSCSPSVDGSCTANALVKVRPDRVCSKWLDCVTYTQDKDTKQRVCYALGQCDRLDDTGECANFINDTSTGSLRFSSYETAKNLSGYSLLNKYDLSRMKEGGMNSEAHFDFEDSIPSLSCERGIDYANPASPICTFDKDILKDSLVRSPEGVPTDYPAHGRTYLKVPATYQISPQAKGNYITLELPRTSTSNVPYYINYLINTKTSGLNTKLIIYRYDTNPANRRKLYSFTHSGNNGWTRVIDKFYINSTNNKIIIYLTSDADQNSPKESGFVYFDDINIEPVLEIGPDSSGAMQYAARECRLYPTNDSLTCLDNTSNTASKGLEGYCLEHDPFNSSICQLWYPVDKISSSKGFSTAFGYQSKFPLNYCTEASGNFDFVEKRTGFKWADNKEEIIDPLKNRGVQVDALPVASWTVTVSSTTPVTVPGEWRTVNYENVYCSATKNREEVTKSNRTYEVASSTEAMVPVGTGKWEGDTYSETYCQVSSYRSQEISSVTHYYQYWDCETTKHLQDWACVKSTHQGCFRITGSPYCDSIQADVAGSDGVLEGGGAGGNYDLYISHIHGDGPVYTKYMCVPNESKLLVVTGTDSMSDKTMDRCQGVTYSVGWGKYDGFLRRDHADCDHPGCENYNEKDNATPPIRIQDYNQQANSEAGLRLVSDSSSDNVFRLTCNKFAETVEASGENKAWTWRTGKSASYATSTPPFFGFSTSGSYNNYGLVYYGRNRDAAPFGAATWTTDYDLLNSGRIILRDRYSQDESQTTFAGRPYGCAGDSCGNIGFCSMNPNIYCLYNEQSAKDRSVLDISGKTCEGLGNSNRCVPLWSAIPDHKAVLRNIFLKSYGVYSFGGSGTGYIPVDETFDWVSSVQSCASGVRPDDNLPSSFCAIFPVISNPKLCLGESTVSSDCLSDFRFKKGIYRLQFNSTVDSEQQPLRRIYIDWGDGNSQIVTDQDQHPSAGNPHVFYHYYNRDSQTAAEKPSVRIYDNWERYGSWNP